jgi:hypothetical protein
MIVGQRLVLSEHAYAGCLLPPRACLRPGAQSRAPPADLPMAALCTAPAALVRLTPALRQLAAGPNLAQEVLRSQLARGHRHRLSTHAAWLQLPL